MKKDLRILFKFLITPSIQPEDESLEFTPEDLDELEDLLRAPYVEWDLNKVNFDLIYDILFLDSAVRYLIQEEGNEELGYFYSQHFGYLSFDPDPLAGKSITGHLEEAFNAQFLEDFGYKPTVSLVTITDLMTEINELKQFDLLEQLNLFQSLEDKINKHRDDNNPDDLIFGDVNRIMFELTNIFNRHNNDLSDIILDTRADEHTTHFIKLLTEDVQDLLNNVATTIQRQEDVEVHSFTILSTSLTRITDLIDEAH